MNGLATDAVTLLTAMGGRAINKIVRREPDGTITKAMAPNNGVYLARTVPVPDIAAMADLLRELGTHRDCTLSLGIFKDAPDEPFVILPEKEIARRLGIDPHDRDRLLGFHEIDGKPTVARLKNNMQSGSWLPIDRDTVAGMPPELAGLDRDEWLAAMELLLPRLARARRILLPSTSSRIMVDGTPMQSASYHLLVQVTDPTDIERVWSQLLPKAFAVSFEARPWEPPVPLGFMRPKYSRSEPDTIVAHCPWSIFDPTTGSPERLMFDGAPVTVGAGLEVRPPQIEPYEGERLDLAAIPDLDQPAIERAQQRTGATIRMDRDGKGKRAHVTGVTFISATLSMDLEVETGRGWTTVGELHRQAAGHTRVQAPFRESSSWNAYYGAHHDGQPFIFDNGVRIKYVLSDERTEIRCYGGSLPRNVTDAEKALAEASGRDPAQGVYQRGGVLTRITRLPVATAEGGIRRAAGSLQILTAGPDFLRLRLTQTAIWLKFDKRSEEWVATDAPASVARTLADIAGMWPNTRNLAGIVEAPALRPDGTILDRPGFDPDSGLYFDPGSTEFPSIPASPTRRDAAAALELLTEIIKDFPFVDEASKSVALALLITPAIRYAVRAAPLYGISAPKMSSGKTLLAQLPAYINTGRSPAMMAQADDPQEEKKRLLALLLEGSIVTVLDNCERALKSDALCTALTETVIRDRILGSTRTISVPTTTTWIATGNGLCFDGDLSSRALLCTLDPQCERPEEREFAVNLHEDVPRRRGQLAAAALTVVKAFLAAGAPRQKIPTFGRFEAWSRFAREPLVWLGMADPCATRRAIEARDPVRDKLGNLLEAWHAVFGDRDRPVAAAIHETDPTLRIATVASAVPDNAATTAAALKELRNAYADKLQALRNALETVGENRGHIDGRRLGAFLSRHAGRIERGLRADQAGTRQGVALWSVGCAGYVGSPIRTRKKCQSTSDRQNDSFMYRGGTNPPDPPNPPTGANGDADRDGANGAGNAGTCAHCHEPILPADAFTATGDALLHNRCADEGAAP